MPLSFQNAQPAFGRQRREQRNAALLGRGVKDNSPTPQQRRPIGQPIPLNRIPIGAAHNDQPRHLTPRQHQDLLRHGGIAVAPKEFVFHGVNVDGQHAGGSNPLSRFHAPQSSPPSASPSGSNPILKPRVNNNAVAPERHSHSDGVLSPAQHQPQGGAPRTRTPPGMSSNRGGNPPNVLNQVPARGAIQLPLGLSPQQQQFQPQQPPQFHPTGAINHYKEKQQARQQELLIRQHQLLYQQHKEAAQQQYHYLLGDAPPVSSPLRRGEAGAPSYQGQQRGWVNGNNNLAGGQSPPKATPTRGPRDDLQHMAQLAQQHHNAHQPKQDESVYAIIPPTPAADVVPPPGPRNNNNIPLPAALNPSVLQKQSQLLQPRQPPAQTGAQPQQQTLNRPTVGSTVVPRHTQQQQLPPPMAVYDAVATSHPGDGEIHPLASLPFEIVYCSSQVIGRQLVGEGPTHHGSKVPSPEHTANQGGIAETHDVGEIMRALELHWEELEASPAGDGDGVDSSNVTSSTDTSAAHPQGKHIAHGKGVLSNGWFTYPASSEADLKIDSPNDEGDASYPVELILRFPEGDADIRQIQLLTHEFKIPSKVEIRIFSLEKHLAGHKERLQQLFQKEEKRRQRRESKAGEAMPSHSPIPPGMDDDDSSQGRRELRSTALATLHHNALPSFKDVKFAKLGSVAFSNNEKSRFKAKERKTVHVNTRAYFVKLLFHAPHINQYNNNDTVHKIFTSESGVGKSCVGSQVGVYSILSLGDHTTTSLGSVVSHVDTALFTPSRQPARRLTASSRRLPESVDNALAGAGGHEIHRDLTSGTGGRPHGGVGAGSRAAPDRETRKTQQLVNEELYHASASNRRSTGPTPEVPEVVDAPAYDLPPSRFPPIQQPHIPPMGGVAPRRQQPLASHERYPGSTESSPNQHSHRDSDTYPYLFSPDANRQNSSSLVQLRSRPIIHFESYYQRTYNQLIEQKNTAIDNEDFDTAKSVKGRLVILQDKTKKLLELESQKIQSIVEEDFERSAELRDRMSRLIKETYAAISSATIELAGRRSQDPDAGNQIGAGPPLPKIRGAQQVISPPNGQQEDLWDGGMALPPGRRSFQPVNQDEQPVMSKYAQKMAVERRREEDSYAGEDHASMSEDLGHQAYHRSSSSTNIPDDGDMKSSGEGGGHPRKATIAVPELNPPAVPKPVDDASPPFYERWEDPIVAYIHQLCDEAVDRQREEAVAAGGSPVDAEAFPYESRLTDSASHQTGSLGGGGSSSAGEVKRTEVGPLQQCFGVYTTACLLSRRWRLREAAMKCIRQHLLTLYSNPANPNVNTAIGTATEASHRSNNPNLNAGAGASNFVQNAVLTLCMYLDVKGLGITDPVASVAITACGLVEAIASQEFNGGAAVMEEGGANGKHASPFYVGAVQNLLPRLMFRAADPSPSAGKVREECARIIVNVLPEPHALGVDRVVIGGILPHPTDADKKRLAEPLGTKVQLSRVTMFSSIMDRYRGTKGGRYFSHVLQSSIGSSNDSDSSGGAAPPPQAKILSLEILLKRLIMPSLNHPSTEVREAAVVAFGKIPVDFSSAKVANSEHIQRFLQQVKNPTIKLAIEERLVSSLPPAQDSSSSALDIRRSPSPAVSDRAEPPRTAENAPSDVEEGSEAEL